MQQIQNKALAELLMQLRFTPEEKRRKQLDAAEKLIDIVEPDKEYPFEFVWFRITGFTPKTVDAGELISGQRLLDDLRVFVARLSSPLAEHVRQQSEKVFSIEELSDELNVSTKTIRRWRKRGLVARKFVFEDGVKRFGFARSNVDRFLEANPGLAAKAKQFRRLTAGQKQEIISRARQLASAPHDSRHQVIVATAEAMGTSVETVRATIIRYEQTHPDKPIFSRPGGVLDSAQAAEVYRLYRLGVGVGELTERFGRSRSTIYRIIRTRRAKALLAQIGRAHV